MTSVASNRNPHCVMCLVPTSSDPGYLFGLRGARTLVPLHPPSLFSSIGVLLFRLSRDRPGVKCYVSDPHKIQEISPIPRILRLLLASGRNTKLLCQIMCVLTLGLGQYGPQIRGGRVPTGRRLPHFPPPHSSGHPSLKGPLYALAILQERPCLLLLLRHLV